MKFVVLGKHIFVRKKLVIYNFKLFKNGSNGPKTTRQAG